MLFVNEKGFGALGTEFLATQIKHLQLRKTQEPNEELDARKERYQRKCRRPIKYPISTRMLAASGYQVITNKGLSSKQFIA